MVARQEQAAITEGGLKGVMPCYCSLNGTPVSSAPEYLTELLREEMGFGGVIVADYNAIANVHEVQKVGETLADAGFACLKAGLDVELPEKNAYNEELAARLAADSAEQEILDRAVLRILTSKFRMGLFEHPFAASAQGMAEEYAKCVPEAEKLSLQSARESIVLLKNDGVLPVKADAYINRLSESLSHILCGF